MEQALREQFHEDGAILYKNCLNEEELGRCRDAFDWAVENYGPHASRMFEGTEQESHVDWRVEYRLKQLDDRAAA